MLILLCGCPGPGSDGTGSSDELPLAGVELRLMVVGDPELAAAAERLQGEWTAQTGAEFQVQSVTEGRFADAGPLAADALIGPSHQLGTAAEAKRLSPIPKRSLEDDLADWPDLFELLRRAETVWGTDVRAVPFGSPVLTCYYRADLLKKLGRNPAQTWSEYQKLAELLADRARLGDAAPPQHVSWYGTVEPLGPGGAAPVLLARAAPYAKHPDNYSTLFDIRTMEPLVAGPPFVRALEELVAASKLGPPDQLQYDPGEARAAFWQGQCGMALSWPTAAATPLPARPFDKPSKTSHPLEAQHIQVGFAELPGSREVYDVRNQAWERRADNDETRVPLLGVAGRIGMVTAESAHPEAALQLLFWLSGRRFSLQVSAASSATTLFRQSHLATASAWVEKPVPPAAAARYAAATQEAFSRQQWVVAPRIPGRAAYLSALDQAVHRAARGHQPPAAALRQAATRWQQVTQQLGPKRQRAAYLRSLGREP